MYKYNQSDRNTTIHVPNTTRNKNLKLPESEITRIAGKKANSKTVNTFYVLVKAGLEV